MILIVRGRCAPDLHDLHDLYGLAHFAAWDPYNVHDLYDLAHVSRVESAVVVQILHNYPNGRLGYRLSTVDR